MLLDIGQNYNYSQPVYVRHPWDPKFVAVHDKRLLFRGSFKKSKLDTKMRAVVDRMDNIKKFDCTSKDQSKENFAFLHGSVQ